MCLLTSNKIAMVSYRLVQDDCKPFFFMLRAPSLESQCIQIEEIKMYFLPLH